MRRPASLVFAVGFLLLASAPASAGSPTQVLQEFFSAAARVLDPRSPDPAESRLGAIRAMVREIVDVPGAAQFALGRSWSARSQAEIDEFVPLFAEFLEQSLIAGIAARIRLPDGIQIRYLDESVEDTRATVSTTILNRRGVELSFDYRMVERSGRWAIRDVVIDGVSLAGNYRAQFARVMQASSFPELVRQLRARVGAAAPVAARAPDSVPAAFETPRATDVAAEPEASQTPSRPTAIDARLETDVTLTTVAEPAPAPAAAVPEVPAPSVPLVAADQPTPPEPSLPSAQRPSEPAYWVQIGAFRSAQSARRLASLVSSQERATASPSSVVIEPRSADVPLARVRIGPFADRSQAAAKLREVQARGFEPFIAEQRD